MYSWFAITFYTGIYYFSEVLMQHKQFFLGIGAQRAGTSWLYQALLQHPDVYMPRKEVHFFDKHYHRGDSWYSNLFVEAANEQQMGEITPEYMVDRIYLERIKSYDPSVRLIVILRDPIDRAVSAMNLYKAHGIFEDISFQRAIEDDPNILIKSLYSDQIKNILDIFPKENVFIGFYDEIEHSPKEFINKVYRFLELDYNFIPMNIQERRNVSAMAGLQGIVNIPRIQKNIQNSRFQGIFNALKSSRAGQKLKEKMIEKDKAKNRDVEVAFETKRALHNDLVALEELLDRDLSAWKVRVE